MPLVLQEVRRASYRDRRTLLAHSSGFTQTPGTMDEILSIMRSNPKLHDLCGRLLFNVPTHLLQAFANDMPKISSEARRIVRNRLELADLDTPTLFDKLILHSESGRGKFLSNFDYRFGVYIARELVNRSDLPMNAIHPWNDTECPDDYDGYDEIYGCVLAGLLGLEDMVPRLVQHLHLDADLLIEAAAKALTRIGTLEVVQRIAREFAESKWHYRLFAGGVLSTIKHPSAEEAIIKLLREEEDGSICTIS